MTTNENKLTKEEKQAKKQAKAMQVLDDFSQDCKPKSVQKVLWKMLEITLISDEPFIDHQERSNILSTYTKMCKATKAIYTLFPMFKDSLVMLKSDCKIASPSPPPPLKPSRPEST